MIIVGDILCNRLLGVRQTHSILTKEMLPSKSPAYFETSLLRRKHVKFFWAA